jgi:integrase
MRDQDFPLRWHQTGRWYRKIRGRFFYFGKDKDKAIQEWLRVKDHLLAGREPPMQGCEISVAYLVNHFLTAKRQLVESGELSVRTWHSYHASCGKLVAAFGKERRVDTLDQSNFAELRRNIGAGLSPASLRGHVLNIRTVFKFTYDSGLISKPVRYGQSFSIPRKAVLRRARQERDAKDGKRMFQAVELRAVINSCKQPLQTMVLLGINCAFGATDVSSLPATAVDLQTGWISFPRPKTAIERTCPLWPETATALRDVIAEATTPKASGDAGVVFLTRCRQRWVRITENGAIVDSVAGEFAKVLKSLDLKRPRLGFYALRHTFRTIADEIHDRQAIDRIMGHGDHSMAAAYVEQIDGARLTRVTDYVRDWLFEAEDKAIKAAPKDASALTEDQPATLKFANDKKTLDSRAAPSQTGGSPIRRHLAGPPDA